MLRSRLAISGRAAQRLACLVDSNTSVRSNCNYRGSRRGEASTRSFTSSRIRSKSSIAFAFDIDGVLKAGEQVLPEAKRALRVLEGNNARKTRIPYIFITNGGGPSETTRAQKLSKELGVEVKPEQVVQAHTVLQSLTKRFGREPVLMIGGPDLPAGGARDVMNEYGFEDVYTAHDVHAWSHPSWPFASPQAEQGVQIRKVDFSQIAFQAVLVFHDSRDWGRDIQYICDVLRSPNGTIGQLGDDKHQQPFLAFSHGDLIWGNDFSAPRLGQGAFQHALRAVYKQLSGRELQSVTFGKPERLTYEYADILLKEQLASIRSTNTSQEDDVNVYMIGDNPASDIAGANNFGWQSALVRTGVYRDIDGPPAHSPTLLVDNVEEAVKQALKREGWTV